MVTESVSLDGVMQAPGGPDEDTRGGFTQGGWAAPYPDQVMAERMSQGMGEPGAMVLGRRTYEQFFTYWPEQTDGNPFTEHLNAVTKYVVSHRDDLHLPWQNSSLLAGEATGSVAELRDRSEGSLSVVGSGALVRSLEKARLVDEYHLLIHPLLLGEGTRLFAEGGAARPLRLTESVTTTTGVIMAVYVPQES